MPVLKLSRHTVYVCLLVVSPVCGILLNGLSINSQWTPNICSPCTKTLWIKIIVYYYIFTLSRKLITILSTRSVLHLNFLFSYTYVTWLQNALYQLSSETTNVFLKTTTLSLPAHWTLSDQYNLVLTGWVNKTRVWRLYDLLYTYWLRVVRWLFINYVRLLLCCGCNK